MYRLVGGLAEPRLWDFLDFCSFIVACRWGRQAWPWSLGIARLTRAPHNWPLVASMGRLVETTPMSCWCCVAGAVECAQIHGWRENQDIDKLPALGVLHRLGFVEMQDLQTQPINRKWGGRSGNNCNNLGLAGAFFSQQWCLSFNQKVVHIETSLLEGRRLGLASVLVPDPEIVSGDHTPNMTGGG